MGGVAIGIYIRKNLAGNNFRLKNGSLSSRTKPAILRARKRKQSENEDDRQVKHPRVDPSDMVRTFNFFLSRSVGTYWVSFEIFLRIIISHGWGWLCIMPCFTPTATALGRCHLQSQRSQRAIINLWGSCSRKLAKVCSICLICAVVSCVRYSIWSGQVKWKLMC